MTDIIERLNDGYPRGMCNGCHQTVMEEAAEEIRALRKEIADAPLNSTALMSLSFRAKGLVEKLRDALRLADAAMNPLDRGGISLDEWNRRLKSTTLEIRDAVRRADEFLAR